MWLWMSQDRRITPGLSGTKLAGTLGAMLRLKSKPGVRMWTLWVSASWFVKVRVWPTAITFTLGSNWSPLWLTRATEAGAAFEATTVPGFGSSVTTAGLTDGEQVSGISTRPRDLARPGRGEREQD